MTTTAAGASPVERAVVRLVEKRMSDGVKWAMVPQEPTDKMKLAANARYRADVNATARDLYVAMLAAAPEPPHLSMTREEAQTFQNWAGMDGACAFHLIERHANGWGDVARMMDAWLQANSKAHNARIQPGPTAQEKQR